MITGSMIFSGILLVIGLLIVIAITRFKHKLLAIFLIMLVLFGYFSFNFALGGHDVDLTTAKGLGNAFGIYFSWLGSIFGNAGAITSKAVENNSDDNLKGK